MRIKKLFVSMFAIATMATLASCLNNDDDFTSQYVVLTELERTQVKNYLNNQKQGKMYFNELFLTTENGRTGYKSKSDSIMVGWLGNGADSTITIQNFPSNRFSSFITYDTYGANDSITKVGKADSTLLANTANQTLRMFYYTPYTMMKKDREAGYYVYAAVPCNMMKNYLEFKDEKGNNFKMKFGQAINTVYGTAQSTVSFQNGKISQQMVIDSVWVNKNRYFVGTIALINM